MGREFQPEHLGWPAAGLEEELRGLRDLLSVAQIVVSTLELDEVLQNILSSAMGMMDMPAGSIALHDEEQERFVLRAHAGLGLAFLARTRWSVRPGRLTERILEAGDLLVVEDTIEGPSFLRELAERDQIRALIAVPLRVQGRMVGILYLDDFQPRRFSEGRLKLLNILASFAAMSIENARLHERTRRLACTDGLTGLYNYRQFKHMVQEELLRTRRYVKPMSLVMFDVDNFKQFNDRFGHPCGDQVLVHIAEIIKSALRDCDHVFRYGGEEFIAILPETDIEDSLLAAERVRRSVEEGCSLRLQGTAAAGSVLTLSVGVAAYPRDGGDLETLLKAVDDLLYRAKKHGKNKVHYLVRG